MIHVPVTNAKDPPFLGRLGLLRVLRQRKAADFDGLDLRPLVVLSFAEVLGYGLTWVSDGIKFTYNSVRYPYDTYG